MPIKWYPSHSQYPEGSINHLYIHLTPKKLSYTSPVEDKSTRTTIETEPVNERFAFLAPNELQDSVSHNWEPMENIASRLMEKAAQAKKELEFSTEMHRVDTALIYTDSNRREISFTVYLAAYDNPYKNIMEPIEKLREYSAPNLHGKTNWDTKVGNPHVFTLQTKMGNCFTVPIINIKNAALVGIQPSFQGPYFGTVGGGPSYCELNLTFKDLEPMSKGSFCKVTVNGEG